MAEIQENAQEEFLIDEGLLVVTKQKFDIVKRWSVYNSSEEIEEKIRMCAFDCHRALLNKIRDQQPEMIDELWTYKLPQPKSQLPRVMPIPKPKPMTKWERFAKEKNIQNRKRDRLVYDESTKEYVPRYGKGRINETKNEWITEAPRNLPKGQDPFEYKEKLKTERASKNEFSRLKNIKNAENMKNVNAPSKRQKSNYPSKKKKTVNHGNFKDEKQFTLNVISSLDSRS